MFTSNATFASPVPWLLLSAIAVFSLALRQRQWAMRSEAGTGFSYKSMPKLLLGQVIISAYGGYFGEGMGVLVIALYLVATNLDVHAAAGCG